MALLALGTLVASGVALGAGVAQASACNAPYTSQGLSIHNYNGSSNDNGDRARIQGSSTLSSCGLAFAGVAVAENVTSGIPAIQTGYLKETSTETTDCGTGVISTVTEYVNSSGNYTCDVTCFDCTFGEGDTFADVHSSDGWMTYLDGYKELANPITSLNFCCGYSIARAENHWTSNLPTFYVWWGPSGSQAWSYQTPTSGWTDITTSAFPTSVIEGLDNYDGDIDWYRSDQKSPFYFQYTGG